MEIRTTLGFRRFGGCPRCGGDLLEEPGTERSDMYVRYISCLQCGELTCKEMPPVPRRLFVTGAKPGRPRKVQVS